MIPSDRPDACTLAREAEFWATELRASADRGSDAVLLPRDQRSLASLLSSLATITRAAGAGL